VEERCFRFKPGAGEAAREVGGDGGKVGGRGEARSPIICNDDEDNQGLEEIYSTSRFLRSCCLVHFLEGGDGQCAP